MVRKVDLPKSKTSIGDEHLNFMAAAMAQDNEQELADTMTDTFRFYSTAQTIAKITDQYDGSYLSGVFMSSYNTIYKKTLYVVLTNMSYDRNSNIIRDALKLIFWETLDTVITNKNYLADDNKYLTMSWEELGDNLTKKNIFPKVEYTKLNRFPAYKNNSNPALRYKYVTTEEFDEGQEIFLSFVDKEGSHKVSWDQEGVSVNEFEKDLEITDPKFEKDTKKSSEEKPQTKSVSHSDINNAVNETYEVLTKFFPDKPEQQLKSEIASIIYSQADPKIVYYRHFGDSSVESPLRNISFQRSVKSKSTLPDFPDWDINDILDDVIDNLGQAANKQTIGIWFASGLACKNMSNEMKALSDKMDELTELYDFLASDYNNVLNQVYQKALVENGGDALQQRPLETDFKVN